MPNQNREVSGAIGLTPCPFCGTANKNRVLLCKACGRNLDIGTTTPRSDKRATIVESGSQLEACPACGFVLDSSNIRFCGKCGFALWALSRQALANPEKDEESCPGCGAFASQGAVVCTSCGLTLYSVEEPDEDFILAKCQEKESKPPETATFVSGPMTLSPECEGICPACGESLGNDDASCRSCGLVFNSSPNHSLMDT